MDLAKSINFQDMGWDGLRRKRTNIRGRDFRSFWMNFEAKLIVLQEFIST